MPKVINGSNNATYGAAQFDAMQVAIWHQGLLGVRLFEMQEARGKMQRKDAEHKRHERCRNFGRPLCKLVFEKLNISTLYIYFRNMQPLRIRQNTPPKKIFADFNVANQ